MTQDEISTQWQVLCVEQDNARDAYFSAHSFVNQKFAATGNGTSKENPTNGELSDFENTWRTWESVKQRMDEFVKKHA